MVSVASLLRVADSIQADSVDDGLGVVAHAEVTFDGALDARLRQSVLDDTFPRWRTQRHRMHISGGAADVDDEEVPEPTAAARSVSEKACSLHDGGGRRHQQCVEAGGRSIDTLGMDDAVDEHLADRLPCRIDVEHAEGGHYVLGQDRRLAALRKQGNEILSDIAIARDDDRASEPRQGDARGVVANDFAVAAVGSTRQQDDVGGKLGDALIVGWRQPIGKRAHHFGAGPECGLAGGLGSQLAYQTDGHHAQSSRRRGGGEPMLERRQATELALEVGKRGVEPDRHIARHRRGTLCTGQDTGLIEVDRPQLRVGRSEIDEERGGHGRSYGWTAAVRLPCARAAKSSFNSRITSGVRVPGAKARSKPMLEKCLLRFLPAPLADHQVAADIEQDVIQSGLHAHVAEAAAVELALAIER